MYERSALLEILMKRCEVPGKRSISVNKFFIEVLKFLNSDADKLKIPNENKASVLAEANQLRLLFVEKTVDINSSLRKMENYVAKNTEGFMEFLLFDKIITGLQMEGTDEKNLCSAYMVCKRILEEPTAAISNSISKDVEEEDDASSLNEEERRQREEAIKHIEEIIKSLLDDAREDIDGTAVTDTKKPTVTDTKKPTKNSALAEIMERVEKVRATLTDTVFGQNHAISTFVSGFFQSEVSASIFDRRDKPRGTFLFAGPPGVGKTFLSEQAAKALNLPFKRFDMSEYSDKEANLEFCGSDKVYKNGSEGNVTGFVAKHPKCVLLFDEIEKAHLNVIYLFLQMLDAGRLRDNYTDEEVSFTDTIIIFTTNAGKRMYEDESINLLTVSQKAVLNALAEEVNPVTNAPLFPRAICSRFASGNVVMFNRMGADFLLKIAERELQKQCTAITQKMGIDVSFDRLIPYAVLFAQGGKADSRTIKAKSSQFIHDELYELLRLMQSESNSYNVSDLKSVRFELELPKDSPIYSLFKKEERVDILVFSNKEKDGICSSKIDCANTYYADTIEKAKEIIESKVISLVLCDITYKVRNNKKVLNCEDIDSLGMDFFDFVTGNSAIPLYLIADDSSSFSKEELNSLFNRGAKGVFDLSESASKINQHLETEIQAMYLKNSMLELAKANKILTYGSIQKANKEGDKAVIALYDFQLSTVIDAADNEGILNGVSKPNVRFDDVIGANDAKDELKYFIQYLKDPIKYVKRGVKAPKGILLYGDPGTGKTLLAKAMAGESDVTFIKAEGNQFLKRFVGEGSESVHQLFATARKYAPSILFIDEIDAIAKDRQNSPEANNSGDVLTSFLTEMDGFNTDKDRPVFVLAATNFSVEKGTARSLDPALLRRFDRRIYVALPNKEDRIKYINLRLAKIKNHAVSKEMIENLAIRSTGSSLAELDSAFELALRNIIKTEEGVLTDAILEDAFETFNNGEEKKWDESELLRTARHEAGHTVVCWASGEKPSYLTIVARGMHGGYMQHGDTEKKGILTRQDLLAKVRTALGGRAAEIIYYGKEEGVSSGASGDLITATQIVQAMICSYGMDEEIGLSTIDLSVAANSEYYSKIVMRINERLKEELKIAENIISKNRKAIDELVRELMNKNSLKGDEIERILNDNFCAVDE